MYITTRKFFLAEIMVKDERGFYNDRFKEVA
ncbi:hypothetical protein IEK_05595 [Bacillus toyonensis]|jgi:hypothetical protein|nr:hypothetical protein IEK_05595 [Bacillus toyonensis]SMD41310.1 hypothetical protein SAMN06272738_6032 [Bacillus sp. JKS001846]